MVKTLNSCADIAEMARHPHENCIYHEKILTMLENHSARLTDHSQKLKEIDNSMEPLTKCKNDFENFVEAQKSNTEKSFKMYGISIGIVTVITQIVALYFMLPKK